MSARYVFCYDISKPRRLYRVARLLESFGERVQDSVFECWLERSQLRVLMKKLKRHLNVDEDRILVYCLTEAEGQQIKLFGDAVKTEEIQLFLN